MSIQETTQIFISYSRRDEHEREFVDRLATDLNSQEFLVWVDREKIPPGTDWKEEIDTAIKQAEVMLVIISPYSMASQEVRREYTLANKLGKVIYPLIFYPALKIPRLLNKLQLMISFQAGLNVEGQYAKSFQELVSDIPN